MMRIDVNFIVPPIWRTRWAGIVCLVLGVLASGTVVWLGWQTYLERERWNADLQALRQTHAPQTAESGEEDKNAIQAELTAANQIVARLNAPWADLFAALERVYSDNAILLALEPDPDARSVRMAAEAKDTDNMLDFVRQLRASKVFADAYITNHSVNQQDAQHPIRFAVVAHWVDVPKERADSEKSESERASTEGAAPSTEQTPMMEATLEPGPKAESERDKR